MKRMIHSPYEEKERKTFPGLWYQIIPGIQNMQYKCFPHWRKAMEAEFTALQRNNTWYLVPPSSSYKVVDCRWVYKTKFNTDGSVSKYKARLVTKGFQQAARIDYGETFSPVVKSTTIRVVLTLVVSFNWEVRQLNVNNAFLNGILKEEVYMKQPEGFIDSCYPHHVCKLVKAIYGLKQAPRAWFDRLKGTLFRWGFKNARSDVSLFILRQKNLIVFILIYVDDILVTGNNSQYVRQFINKLTSLFSLKDLGPIHYIFSGN